MEFSITKHRERFATPEPIVQEIMLKPESVNREKLVAFPYIWITEGCMVKITSEAGMHLSDHPQITLLEQPQTNVSVFLLRENDHPWHDLGGVGGRMRRVFRDLLAL